MGESDDASWMRRAVELAWQARPSPNPRVGSVVVRDGVLVGEGFHVAVGRDHAETAAVRAAGDRARGATVYVTLEPCNHHGRTPPCTETLIAAGVARVVLGARDPNPWVQGGGIARLRAAGVEVTEGVELEACAGLIRAWTASTIRKRPWVVLKAAASLDGRIATRTGASRWITGPDARRDTHQLRARADAVLVGIGTVLADDPMLTARDVGSLGPPPARVVLDTSLRTPVESQLARTTAEAPVWVLHGAGVDESRRAALRAKGVETVELPTIEGRVSLTAALSALNERGVVEVLVEGGSDVHGAFLDAGLADALVLYLAPMLVGGRSALSAFGGIGAATPDEAPRLRNLAIARIGNDIRLTGEFEHVHGDHHPGR